MKKKGEEGRGGELPLVCSGGGCRYKGRWSPQDPQQWQIPREAALTLGVGPHVYLVCLYLRCNFRFLFIF